MAMASRCAIVEVEEPIVPEGELDPDHIHTSGIFVQRMVKIPPDAILHVGRPGATAAHHPPQPSRGAS